MQYNTFYNKTISIIWEAFIMENTNIHKMPHLSSLPHYRRIIPHGGG